jgi:hypothetical protein
MDGSRNLNMLYAIVFGMIGYMLEKEFNIFSGIVDFIKYHSGFFKTVGAILIILILYVVGTIFENLN